MSAVHRFFLRAKHWQIFLLLFVIPSIAEAFLSGFITAGPIRFWTDVGPAGFLYLGVGLLEMGCLFVWLRSLGSFLNSSQRPDLKLKTRIFGIATIYPFVYVPVFSFDLLVGRDMPTAILLPLHLLAMSCFIYAFAFVAKSLVIANRCKRAVLRDYALQFFQLWFFPVGVWWIQPRINQLYAEALHIGMRRTGSVQ